MLRKFFRLPPTNYCRLFHTSRITMASIEEISSPPTESELTHMQTTKPAALPEKFRRDIHSRIFVNRSVNLENIEYFGCMFFDHL
jgi:hypothetical protein